MQYLIPAISAMNNTGGEACTGQRKGWHCAGIMVLLSNFPSPAGELTLKVSAAAGKKHAVPAW